MSLIKWRDSYSVEVDQFDRQHAVLVKMINDIYTIVRNHKQMTALHDAIDQLVEYTHTHFAEEEAAMEAAGYPGLEEHKRKHDALKQEVEEFVGRIKQEDPNVTVAFYQFLRQWLLNHIIDEDKQYSPYLTHPTVKA